tara:strand:+ start:493 stop:864 length:372 start_codon:yes stop_codon:yes gene_type:complete
MDSLVELVVWSLAVFGTVNIICVGAIFRPFREWLMYAEVDRTSDEIKLTPRKNTLLGKLVNCPMCLGWWVGALWGELVWSPADSFLVKTLMSNFATDMAFNGFLGSIICWLLYLSIKDKQFGH